MNGSRALAFLGIPVITVAAAAVLATTPAAAAAPTNGCPAGYTVLSVDELLAAGYHLPAAIDGPTSGLKSFGLPGNGDGLICGVRLGNQVTPFGGPEYNFIDNQLPA
jgi:hypothetical protein